MWTVVELPHSAPGFPSIDGTMLRHLVEPGSDKTACGLPTAAGRAVRTSWDRAAMHCPVCDQEQGVY